MVDPGNEVPIQDIDEASIILWWPLGTTYRKDTRLFRYGLAGTDLKAGKRAYAHFTPPIGPYYNGAQLARAFWGDLRAKASKGSRLAGIPLIDVRKGQYCWFQVKI